MGAEVRGEVGECWAAFLLDWSGFKASREAFAAVDADAVLASFPGFDEGGEGDGVAAGYWLAIHGGFEGNSGFESGILKSISLFEAFRDVHGRSLTEGVRRARSKGQGRGVQGVGAGEGGLYGDDRSDQHRPPRLVSFVDAHSSPALATTTKSL